MFPYSNDRYCVNNYFRELRDSALSSFAHVCYQATLYPPWTGLITLSLLCLLSLLISRQARLFALSSFLSFTGVFKSTLFQRKLLKLWFLSFIFIVVLLNTSLSEKLLHKPYLRTAPREHSLSLTRERRPVMAIAIKKYHCTSFTPFLTTICQIGQNQIWKYPFECHTPLESWESPLSNDGSFI